MLYVDAIRILEKIAQARFLHATMPKQEEIEEAIKVVASQVTVQACPGFALHAALWWMAIKAIVEQADADSNDVETQEEASEAEEKPGRKGRKTAAE